MPGLIFLLSSLINIPVLTDAGRFLLERNRATSFQNPHKRWLGCEYVRYQYEVNREGIGFDPVNTGSITEECCIEGCDTEEYEETATGLVRTLCCILPLANLLNIYGLTWVKLEIKISIIWIHESLV